MFKRRSYLILILLLALFLRLFKISDFPKTLYGDEQAFAWNAYNILKTGTDEYGTPFPLQFRSFNDYKAPVPVYLLVPVFKLFGMTPASIRIPVSLASLLTVYVFYLLVFKFLPAKISLVSSFLFTVSPWHIHLSRGYFEATLALLFFLIALYFFFKDNFSPKSLLLSGFFFVSALYSYFTPRMLLPLFIPFIIFIGFRLPVTGKKINYKNVALFLILIFILSLPLIKLTFFGQGLSRFNKLNETVSQAIIQTVNNERKASNLPHSVRPFFHNKATVWLRFVKNNYLEHFSLNFWYIYGDNSLRYFLGNMGMFYLFEMPFFILGLVTVYARHKNLFYFLSGWLLLAPVPASVVGRSFAVRSLSMLPVPFIFVAAGIDQMTSFIKNRPSRKIFILTLTMVTVTSIGAVLIRYYLEYPVYAATWWGWENKAAIDYAKARENKYQQIFISDFYTGSTLAYAVYNNFDPLKYRQAVNNPVVMADNRHFIKLGKYYFGSLDLDEKRLSEGTIPKKSLYIGRPEEAASDETINAPDDGRIIFIIHKTE
ncbi:hypothetical protein A3D05_04620 [Candidatus Gottesmanbacteria bacterium RIFCSPHIGHO2_02_FULL_40_24]|nr:MAG: hypothetical protein A3D05_04620 [Candidatus Gottesmanbacteria bacterium RIFCSPHIGHO2_02_FULL_40_24]OGG33264.1 MAG: hypothetical protein A3I80_02390 [Candidatus Gottesmanbacteria bacterium RIFCSPLOWO2_02_FULL_40_10]